MTLHTHNMHVHNMTIDPFVVQADASVESSEGTDVSSAAGRELTEVRRMCFLRYVFSQIYVRMYSIE